MISRNDQIQHLAASIEPYVKQSTLYHPQDTEYKKLLTQILTKILAANVLYQKSIPEYEDALHDTCLCFCRQYQKLAPKGAIYLINWFNRYLRWKIYQYQKRSTR